MRVLIILLNGAEDPNTVDRAWRPADRFAAIYYGLADAGAEIVLVSAHGGAPDWSIPGRDVPGITEASARLNLDRTVRDQLADTIRLDQVALEDFDAIIFIGLPHHQSDRQELLLHLPLATESLSSGKIVAISGLPALELPADVDCMVLSSKKDRGSQATMVRMLLAVISVNGSHS